MMDGDIFYKCFDGLDGTNLSYLCMHDIKCLVSAADYNELKINFIIIIIKLNKLQ